MINQLIVCSSENLHTISTVPAYDFGNPLLTIDRGDRALGREDLDIGVGAEGDKKSIWYVGEQHRIEMWEAG